MSTDTLPKKTPKKTKEPKAVKEPKATKEPKPAWKRLSTSPFLHWAAETRSAAKSPIHCRSAKATAESITEGAQISICVDLLRGEGPKELQALFNTQVAQLTTAFNETFPDYKYKIGGIRPKAE